MKLEIRKETQPNGDMFFYIYQDETFLKSYWIGNHLTGEQCCYDGIFGEDRAMAKAKEYYEKFKATIGKKPTVEIIHSEEI
jgi:hypothetical protein